MSSDKLLNAIIGFEVACVLALALTGLSHLN